MSLLTDNGICASRRQVEMEISTKRHDQKNLPGGISVLLNTFEGALRKVPVNVAMDFFSH